MLVSSFTLGKQSFVVLLGMYQVNERHFLLLIASASKELEYGMLCFDFNFNIRRSLSE